MPGRWRSAAASVSGRVRCRLADASTRLHTPRATSTSARSLTSGTPTSHHDHRRPTVRGRRRSRWRSCGLQPWLWRTPPGRSSRSLDVLGDGAQRLGVLGEVDATKLGVAGRAQQVVELDAALVHLEVVDRGEPCVVADDEDHLVPGEHRRRCRCSSSGTSRRRRRPARRCRAGPSWRPARRRSRSPSSSSRTRCRTCRPVFVRHPATSSPGRPAGRRQAVIVVVAQLVDHLDHLRVGRRAHGIVLLDRIEVPRAIHRSSTAPDSTTRPVRCSRPARRRACSMATQRVADDRGWRVA